MMASGKKEKKTAEVEWSMPTVKSTPVSGELAKLMVTVFKRTRMEVLMKETGLKISIMDMDLRHGQMVTPTLDNTLTVQGQ
jgi:hypothetical protein